VPTPRSLCLLLCLYGLLIHPQEIVTAQVPPTPRSCDGAVQFLVQQASGIPTDTSFFRLTKRGDADAVLLKLTDLALGSPRCAAAVGVRGLVKLRLRQTDWHPKDGPGQRSGVSWDEDAFYDLTQAAKAGGEPGAAAATSGARFLLAGKVDRPYLVRELGPTLLQAMATPSSIPDTIQQFHRGRVAAWLGLGATADSSFSAYQQAGGSPERAALELARARLATGMPGSDSLYYFAASVNDPKIIAELREDLALVADSAELVQFDAAGPRRAAWLRTFWEDRDLESLRPRGTRLHEHYRRINTARRQFRLLSYPRQYELNELWRNRDAEYDDRGLVYIRHGEPDQTASALRGGACPNTSWLYRRSEGNLLFHFVARQNPDDWRLVETLANVGGANGATTRLQQAGSSRRCAPIPGLLESRSDLDPIYGQLAVQDSRINWERELAITTRSREVGTTTDSDLPRFRGNLDVVWRAYALLGQTPGQGRALVLVSVPAASLAPISQQPLAYAFRTRLVARSGAHAVEVDSMRVLTAHEVPREGQMLTFIQEVSLPADRWSIGVVLEQRSDSAGQILRDQDVSLPNASKAVLAMSDIVLGDAAGGRPWTAPDGPFPLSSTGVYTRGQPIPIYYEIAGAEPGAQMETEITLSGEKGKNRSVIRFSERVAGSVLRVRRELSTSRSKPGRYTIVVRIRSGDREAEREAPLSIIGK
jgi:GWxTD domain-containing protein